MFSKKLLGESFEMLAQGHAIKHRTCDRTIVPRSSVGFVPVVEGTHLKEQLTPFALPLATSKLEFEITSEKPVMSIKTGTELTIQLMCF